jgi:hypothetical protein
MFYNQSTNSLIRQFSNSLINLLHRARKYNKIMQNEPNFKIAQIYISACIIDGYGVFQLLVRQKNEPKRTQNACLAEAQSGRRRKPNSYHGHLARGNTARMAVVLYLAYVSINWLRNGLLKQPVQNI